VNSNQNRSLLVTKSYVDNSQPNLRNYATKDELQDLSDYGTKN
jgi:hypothetical protein